MILLIGALLAGLLAIPGAPQVASADSGCPSAAGSYAAGAGTAASPWQIATAGQLQRLRDDSITGYDDSFVLTANIDMGGCTWTKTIGDSSKPFKGTIDGAGHVVSNLTITISGSLGNAHAGLVGRLDSPGVITRLGFTGSVTATSTSVSSVYAYAGGLVGEATSGTTISYSYASGAVSATATSGSVNGNSYSYAGGLVGSISGTTVTLKDSYATGNVTSSATYSIYNDRDAYAGGAVGITASYPVTITNNYATGTASATGSIVRAGGFIGYRGSTGTVTGNFWDTTSSGTATGVGAGSAVGIAGKATTQMQAFATYDTSAWAITNGGTAFAAPTSVWGICTGSTRAFLLWQYSTSPCATAPGAPTITGVTPAGTTASVAFTVDDTGGAALTRLEFALDDTVTVDDSTTNLASPFTLANLSSGTTYAVYMRAVNSQGTGPWSAASVFTTLPPPPPTPASAPRDVVATAGDGAIEVGWQPPSSTGSYSVTNYLATASPGGRTCLSATTTCAITGLTNGVTYTVRVQALTGAGWSPASDPSNAVTPQHSTTKSLSITGSRGSGPDRRLVTIRGTSTGLAGQRVTMWFSFDGEAPSPSKTTALISDDGTFVWSRRSAREITFYAEAAGVQSNTITVQAR